MKVVLLRDLREENWLSMDRYADSLLAALRSRFGDQAEFQDFSVRDVRLPFSLRQILRRLPVVKYYAQDRYFSRYVSYPWQMRRCRSDVYHILDHSYGHLAYHLDPQRTIVTCHDLSPLLRRQELYNESPWSRTLIRLFEYSIGGLRRAARVLADSENTRRDVQNYLDLAGDRVTVIPLGIDCTFFRVPDRAALEKVRAKFGLVPGQMLLHVGSCDQRKNIEGLLKAFKILVNQNHSNIGLVRVGPPLTTEQRVLARDLGIQERIIELGQVSDCDLAALYRLASALVLPSHYEGFGLPVAEAMACGTPVVAANVSSLPEVVGDAGLLVSPENPVELAEAMQAVLSNDRLREQLIAKGLARAQEFRWERVAEKTFQVYQQVYSASR